MGQGKQKCDVLFFRRKLLLLDSFLLLQTTTYITVLKAFSEPQIYNRDLHETCLLFLRWVELTNIKIFWEYSRKNRQNVLTLNTCEQNDFQRQEMMAFKRYILQSWQLKFCGLLKEFSGKRCVRFLFPRMSLKCIFWNLLHDWSKKCIHMSKPYYFSSVWNIYSGTQILAERRNVLPFKPDNIFFEE